MLNHPQVLGIDLSGPSNHADTCIAWRRSDGKIDYRCDCSDYAIVQWVSDQKLPVWIFMDAPLSYHDGGGYRPCDAQLRRFLNAQSLNRLGVMVPTMTKMVYLTLRGMSLAQQLTAVGAMVFETHPGASLVLSGMAAQQVYQIKKEVTAIDYIVHHWQTQGMSFVTTPTTDHQIMATQALLTGERWLSQQCYWQCGNWIV